MYCKQLDTCALYSWHKFKIYVEIVGILIVFILSGVVVFEFLLFTNLFYMAIFLHLACVFFLVE